MDESPRARGIPDPWGSSPPFQCGSRVFSGRVTIRPPGSAPPSIYGRLLDWMAWGYHWATEGYFSFLHGVAAEARLPRSLHRPSRPNTHQRKRPPPRTPHDGATAYSKANPRPPPPQQGPRCGSSPLSLRDDPRNSPALLPPSEPLNNPTRRPSLPASLTGPSRPLPGSPGSCRPSRRAVPSAAAAAAASRA